MNNCIIYAIRCKVNNKMYIGQTTRSRERFMKHLTALKGNYHYNRYLQQDYNKYGNTNFEIITLRNCNKEELNYWEDYYIDYYGGIDSTNIYNFQNNKTKNKELSYHISQAHKGKVAWNKNRKMTPEECEVNRRSHLGVTRSEESIIKQKITISNNPNFGNKGKHLSDSTKQKISEANKGKTAYNKGIRNKTHKYDYIIPTLKQEYNELHSYKAVQNLHPDMRYDTIYTLIRYGYLYPKLK